MEPDTPAKRSGSLRAPRCLLMRSPCRTLLESCAVLPPAVRLPSLVLFLFYPLLLDHSLIAQMYRHIKLSPSP